MIDAEKARRDTPGCAHVVHFNSAGAALMPKPVLDACVRHLQLEAEIGGYEAAAREEETIAHVYTATAALLGAQADEIAIVENATRAWDMAFYAFDFKPGDRILTSESEYASNYLAYLQVAERTGAVIEPVPSDESGQIDLDALQQSIDGRVRLISISHIPTNGGLVQPAAEVGKIARAAGIPYLLDACQSAGQLPLDVKAIGCDMLSATSRKYLRGPRGVGFLYVRRGFDIRPPFIDLHAAEWTSKNQYTLRRDARRFENWEGNVAAKIGFGAAVDYALALGQHDITACITELAQHLRASLASLPGVAVHDIGRTRCGIVSFTVEDVRAYLSRRRINVTTSTTFGTRLDMERRSLPEIVRASLHYYNTEEEIAKLGDILAEL